MAPSILYRSRFSLLALFVLLPLLSASAQENGIEGHPPGRGRPADTVDVRYFGIEIINQEDRRFFYVLRRETPARVRPNRTPGGGGNWKLQLSGFDRKMIRVTDSTIVPLRVGRTQLAIGYPLYSDTVELVIGKVGSRLVLDYDRASLARTRRERLYRVNTWDTIGGAAREKAMGGITVGMPIEQARALMNTDRFRTSSELPGVEIYAIDLRRSIYLEEKEGRVAKVSIGESRLGMRE